VKCVESEEYRELKVEIETIKEQIVKLEKELLSVKRLAEKAYDTAAML
jgi:predicted  nucleic acid-binding Zn-ribbon protein